MTFDEQISRVNGYGNSMQREDGWTSGCVETVYGYVRVESSDISARTWLSFIRAGRRHVRMYYAHYQPRYLITLAKRFARDIATQEAPTP